MASNDSRRYDSSSTRRSRSSASSRTSTRSSNTRRDGYRAVEGGRSGRRRYSSRSVSSVRVGDIRNAQRAERASQAPESKFRKRLRIVLISIGTLVAVLAVAFAVLSFTNAFTIKQVTVEGVEHLTAEEVSELAAVPKDATLLNVDTDMIKQRLLKDAWIQSVQILRMFPSTLDISVSERTIVAVVEVPVVDTTGVRNWAISSDNIWLMPIPDKNSEAGKMISPKIYEDAEQVLHISDVSYGEEPEIGGVCTNENVNCALSIVSGMTTSLADRVREVKATDTDSTTLVLDNGVEIAFGSAENIRDKERVCLQLLEEYEGEIAYINVRVVDNPMWRSL